MLPLEAIAQVGIPVYPQLQVECACADPFGEAVNAFSPNSLKSLAGNAMDLTSVGTVLCFLLGCTLDRRLSTGPRSHPSLETWPSQLDADSDDDATMQPERL